MKKLCCSVIVTFNRKELLYRNICKNIEQTTNQDILIIDNASTDGTYDYLCSKGIIENERVIYLKNNENEFGAGGFYKGLEYVFSHGYQFAWLMDDDGYPVGKNCLDTLLKVWARIGRCDVILNSAVISENNVLSFKTAGIWSYDQLKQIAYRNEFGIIQNKISPFNGTLISKEAFEKIGNVKKEYKIHGDEREYLRRAILYRIFVATVVDSVFFHPRFNGKVYVYKGKEYEVRITSPLTELFEIRNYLYISRIYNDKKFKKRSLDAAILKILYAKKSKIKYCLYIMAGIITGIIKKC